MRRLHRPALSDATAEKLEELQEELQEKLDGTSDRGAPARTMWRRRRNSVPKREAFDEVKTKLRGMASGRERCMYCEDSEGTDIDHFWPKSCYPGRTFEWGNYLHACSRCNSNEKRDKFPLDVGDRPLLIDPTAEDPAPHFQLVPETGQLVPLSAKGEASATVFALNGREVLTKGRQRTWAALLELLRGYDDALSRGDAQRAKRGKEVVCDMSFSCVLVYMVALAYASVPDGAAALPSDVRRIIRSRSEIGDWLTLPSESI